MYKIKAMTERKISSPCMPGHGVGVLEILRFGASRCRRICKYTPELML